MLGPCATLLHSHHQGALMSSAVTTQVTELQNYINGGWRRPSSTEFFDVTNPATTEVLARTPMSTPADVDAAVQAAADAFPSWRRTPPGERVQYLFKLKNLLEEHLDELSRLITLENGKTFAEAKAELRRGIENVEVACGIPMMMQGYHLEDVTPRVDERETPPAFGGRALLFPLHLPCHDFLLVPAVCHCLREHVCAQALRARPPQHDPRLRTGGKNRPPQRRRQSCQRRQRCRQRALRSSSSTRHQLRGFYSCRQARLCTLGCQRQAHAMPGRRKKSRHRPARRRHGTSHANHQRQRLRLRRPTLPSRFRSRHHWRCPKILPRFHRPLRFDSPRRQWPRTRCADGPRHFRREQTSHRIPDFHWRQRRSQSHPRRPQHQNPES